MIRVLFTFSVHTEAGKLCYLHSQPEFLVSNSEPRCLQLCKLIRSYLLFAMLWWTAPTQTRATTYVISTDGAPQSNGYLQAIGATQGTNTPGFVFLSPTSLGSINGTTINFGG